MGDSVTSIVTSQTFAQVAAEDRRRVVIAHAAPSLAVFFPVVLYIGVMEWITRPTHRTAAVIVGLLSVRFIVTDTGEGIPSDALPRIFERFRRATHDVKGFGLGLYIVKRFAEVLGGGVHVESKPGAGTRFEVTLPRRAPSADAEPLRAVG